MYLVAFSLPNQRWNEYAQFEDENTAEYFLRELNFLYIGNNGSKKLFTSDAGYAEIIPISEIPIGETKQTN